MAHMHKQESGKAFKIGLILNTGFTIVEMIAGVATGSLALIADATHNLTDSLTLGIAFIAERISQKDADEKQSYGYGRSKIIASLLNAGILVGIACFIGYEAVIRLNEPTEVPGLVVAAVAAVGIVINGTVAYTLSKQKHDLNAKSAYTNMLYDTLSSVGALAAGFAIALFGWTWLDSVVGILIALMLLFATVGIIKEAIHILLEGVPNDVDLGAVRQSLVALDGVLDIDDVHAWTIDNDYYAFSCHLIISKSRLADSRQIVEDAKKLLAGKHNFMHTTIEVELQNSQSSIHHEHA